MKFPQALIDARAALEAGMNHRGEIMAKGREFDTIAREAKARIAVIDPEIGRLETAVTEYDALHAAGLRTRMTAPERAAAKERVIALYSERETLEREQRDGATKAAALLAASTDYLFNLVDPARTFRREWLNFTNFVWHELNCDVGRLGIVPMLTRWYCIADGLGFLGMVANLNDIRIMGAGGILSTGTYNDPVTQQWIDLKTAWKSEPELVALHGRLRDLVLFNSRQTGLPLPDPRFQAPVSQEPPPPAAPSALALAS